MNDTLKLARIQIEGFKSIKKMDLELTNLNVLIGQNGAGKSNFISLFKFIKKIAEKNLQNYVDIQNGAENFLYFGNKKTSEIKIDLFTLPVQNFQLYLKPTREDNFKIITNFINVRDVYESKLADKLNMDSIQVIQYVNAKTEEFQNIASPFEPYHFHDTSDSAKVKKTNILYDNDYLRPQAENLAAFLYFIREKHPLEYEQIVTTIQRIAPFFHDFILIPEKLNPDTIRLKWKHKASDDYFDANSLSDGTLRFIFLATLLLQPELPSLILLDEPELGLHPFAIHLLGGMLRSVANKTQIILATQSVILANQFGWHDLIVVDYIDNASQFRRLEKNEVERWLENYQLGEIWEKNLIGGNP